jgi:hypothetical protein
MDTTTFDTLSRSVATSLTRRSALRGLVAGAAGLVAGGVLLGAEDTAARRKKGKGGKGGKGNARCLKSGDLCESDRQCCGTNQICDVPTNASNSDTRCCGASGAVCGGVNEDGDAQPPFCCIGEAGRRAFVCSENDPENPGVRGTCLPAPDDEL